MILNQLESIEFKNRPWLLLIIIPFSFFLFILTFSIYFLSRDHEEKIWFFITLIIFILELTISNRYFSKLRYVPNGKLQFDDDGIKLNKGKTDFIIKWEEVDSFKQFYRGDRFWKLKLLKYTFYTKGARYRNLRWNFKKILDEQMLDCVEINNKRFYVKIRNQDEKQIFMNLLSYAKQKVQNAIFIQTP